MLTPTAAAALRASFARDGAAVVRNAFSPAWLEVISAGIQANLRAPGPFASENVKNAKEAGAGDQLEGCFFDDYVNWRRIPEFERVVRESPARDIAAAAMGTVDGRCQFFHDHVLVKEPGTTMATPWHQDAPYYFVDGSQTVSMWIPLEAVDAGGSTLRFIAGSHQWGKLVRPLSWADSSDFHDPGTVGADDFLSVPDPDEQQQQQQQQQQLGEEKYDGSDDSSSSSSGSGKDAAVATGSHSPPHQPPRVLEWSLEPGDAVLFHFRTVHGARGNFSSTERRRALSLRWVGCDSAFVDRPGNRTSPPLSAPFGHGENRLDEAQRDNHGMRAGEHLREDWFPIL